MNVQKLSEQIAEEAFVFLVLVVRMERFPLGWERTCAKVAADQSAVRLQCLRMAKQLSEAGTA